MTYLATDWATPRESGLEYTVIATVLMAGIKRTYVLVILNWGCRSTTRKSRGHVKEVSQKYEHPEMTRFDFNQGNENNPRFL